MGAILTACGPKAAAPWHQEQGYRWRELDVPSGRPGFTHMEGGRSSITFQNDVSDSVLLGNRILGQGAGIALGDVDGDGRVDIFLAKTQGCSALYRNLGDWKFEDITRSAGVGACDRHSTGAAFVDVDGDGDLDLILLSTNGPNSIFLNDGHGRFTESKTSGLDPTGKGGTTIAVADVDGDGWPDMYVANYKPYSVEDSLPPQLRSFNQLGHQRDPKDPKSFEVAPERRNDYKLVNRPDVGGIRLTTRGAPDDFYLNHAGHFERVPLTASRFTGADGKRLTEEPESFGLGAKFVDLNGDGAPDLYVANDFEDLDQLWFNDGHGGFRLAPWTAQRQISNSAMGVDVADLNGDGIPDIFEVDMLSDDSHRLKTQIPTHSPFPKKPGQAELELQQQRNALFLNRGDGTFEETSMAAGVGASGWSWSTMLMDVDLDGRQDILIANGHLWDIMDADVQERLQNRLTDVAWQKQRWQFPALKLKNVAYRNRGDGTFEDVSQQWRWGVEDDISHAIAAADLDGDGDLDVVVNRLRAPALVLRNDAPAPRVAIRVKGEAPNTQAIGARLTLRGGAVPVQEHEVTAGGLYLSHSDYLASFAMGKADSATLEIRWRDGKRTALTVRANRMYEIDEKTATPAAAPADSAHLTLFEDVSSQLGGHTHVENVFDEWDRQFLLPDGLSQLGPGIAWFDLDGDGRADLLVGTGKGGQIATFHNDGARLAPRPSIGTPAANDLTTILGMTENGVTRVLAGQSTWEARSIDEMKNPAAALEFGVRGGTLAPSATPLIGSHETSTGPMALADYDGDGDLDLFVGGRAIAMRYPEPGSSGLFHNVNGHFVLDTANSQLLRNIGLVSAAVFADVNGDGKPDLILAREWNSIALFLNDGSGHFHAAPESWGLGRWTSRWNGIATGDFDGDGRLDLVATSWGRNIVEQADTLRPLYLYYGPFGAKQEDEMLLARRDPRVGGIAPLNSYARVRVAMPDVVTRLPTFAAYADATIDKVLGPSTLQNTTRLEANTMDHMVFLNRGDHFEAVPLPFEAQLAPAFYAGVADFNGDGFEDLFLSQNFYPTMIGEPRYDSGRGLLLLGDGKGGLRPASGAESGIVVYGDQRGAAYADYDGDGRLDLAISQNGAATRLYHNRGAKPGLRVRLKGAPGNPTGVGAQIRIVYGSTMGPVREVEAGSGYWSQNGATQVFGLSGTPTEVWVRWPGGAVARAPVPSGAKEIQISVPK